MSALRLAWSITMIVAAGVGGVISGHPVYVASLTLLAAVLLFDAAMHHRLADYQREHIALLDEELADVRRCLATAIEDRTA